MISCSMDLAASSMLLIVICACYARMCILYGCTFGCAALMDLGAGASNVVRELLALQAP